VASADIATLGVLELDAHFVRLRDMLISTDKTLRTGHTANTATRFVVPNKSTRDSGWNRRDRGTHRSEIPFQEDTEAAEAYELLQRIKIVVSRLNAALHARAAERPVQLRLGKTFGPHHKLGNEKLDGDVVYETVKRLARQATADAAVARVATKTRLRRGAQGQARRGEGRDRGGSGRRRIRAQSTTVIEEYDTKPQLVTTATNQWQIHRLEDNMHKISQRLPLEKKRSAH